MHMTQRNYGCISCTKCSFLLISPEALTYSKQFGCKKTTLHCLHEKKWVECLWNSLIKTQNGIALCLTWVFLEYMPGLWFWLVLPVKGSQDHITGLQGMPSSYMFSSQSHWPTATERLTLIIQLQVSLVLCCQKQNKDWSCVTFSWYVFACLK